MVNLPVLWLPILVSAVAAWILNAVFWTAAPHHKADWKALPDDGGIIGALRATGVGRGMYYFPRELRGEPAAPERATLEAGPSGFIVVRRPGQASMGTAMLLAFLLNLAVSVLAAYVASIGTGAGTGAVDVFRLVATFVFAAYAAAKFSDAIWFGHAWASVWKSAADAAIIALVTGGIFVWLWPL